MEGMYWMPQVFKLFVNCLDSIVYGLDLNRLRKHVALKLRHYGLTLSPEVRNEKNTRNSYDVRFGGRIDCNGSGSEAR